jgi:hypothetical protein
MRHPKEIGDESTLAIMHALQLKGYRILLPFGENTRYDLAIEADGRLRRVQCKTGRYRNGAVWFPTCSSYAHHPNPKVTRRSYVGQIDDFAVFCPTLGTVYLIAIEDVPLEKEAALRVEPPRNGQVKRIRLAARYELLRFEVHEQGVNPDPQGTG